MRFIKLFMCLWVLMTVVFLVNVFNFHYRILMICSIRWRKRKLQWDTGVDKNQNFVLDFCCQHHCDFLMLENFTQNFSKSLVKRTLRKVCLHHQEEQQKGILEKKEILEKQN